MYGPHEFFDSREEEEEYNRVRDSLPYGPRDTIFSFKYDSACEFEGMEDSDCTHYPRNTMEHMRRNKIRRAGTWEDIMSFPKDELFDNVVMARYI